MAKVIAKIFNLDIQINAPIKDGYLPSPINKMPINVARLINLGWKPNVEFPEGIVKTIEYSRGINEMFTNSV